MHSRKPDTLSYIFSSKIDGEEVPSSEPGCRQEYDGQVAQLVINEVTLEHAGKYKMVAQNTGGDVTSECNITVKSKGMTHLKMLLL